MKFKMGLLGVLLIFSTQSFAQFTWYPPVGIWPGPLALTGELNTRSLRASVRPKTNSPKSLIRQPVVPRVKVTLTYVSSAARTRMNLSNFVAKNRMSDPEGAAKMEEMFASVDIIAEIGKNIAPYGLKTNNVADAYAVYWINAWEASRGIVGSTETRERAQAVRTQASNAMAAVPALATATDAQKQEYAEAMFIQAAMIAAHVEVAAGDDAQLAAVAAAVAQGAKAMGLGLDTMDLTPNGFVRAE
jgi:hypothetical protein